VLRSNWITRYGVAVLSIAVATGIRLLFHPQLEERVPLTLYFLSVMITAWYGGMGPAFAAVALGVLAAAHFFILPDNSLWISKPADLLALIVFLFVAIFSVLLNQWLGHARRLAEENAAESARLNEELRRTNQYKDEFLAVLAHELRNPLASIHNALQVMQLKKDNPQSVDKMQVILQRQAQAIMRLVDDLLDASRINRGTLELRCETIDLNTVLEHAVEMAQPKIDANGHQLEFRSSPTPIWVNADPLRLTQVFINLLDNACKFTDRGGQITLSAEQLENQVLVRCSDTGVGIAKEMLPHIFERFMQAEPDSDRSRSGLGIGLALAQSLIDAHGGSIEVESSGLGQGSEFIVKLPAVSAPLIEVATTSQAPRSSGRRILIVDDAVDAATSLALLLQFEGHEITVRHDGLSGLAAYRSEKPDIVLLDLKMPGIDGYEVARRIRQQADSRDVTLIALTGWGHEEDRRHTQEAGFDHHLVKPINFAKLGELLQDFSSSRAPKKSEVRTGS